MPGFFLSGEMSFSEWGRVDSGGLEWFEVVWNGLKRLEVALSVLECIGVIRSGLERGRMGLSGLRRLNPDFAPATKDLLNLNHETQDAVFSCENRGCHFERTGIYFVVK